MIAGASQSITRTRNKKGVYHFWSKTKLSFGKGDAALCPSLAVYLKEFSQFISVPLWLNIYYRDTEF